MVGTSWEWIKKSFYYWQGCKEHLTWCCEIMSERTWEDVFPKISYTMWIFDVLRKFIDIYSCPEPSEFVKNIYVLCFTTIKITFILFLWISALCDGCGNCYLSASSLWIHFSSYWRFALIDINAQAATKWPTLINKNQTHSLLHFVVHSIWVTTAALHWPKMHWPNPKKRYHFQITVGKNKAGETSLMCALVSLVTAMIH